MLWYEDIPYAFYDHCKGWESTLAPSGPLIYLAGKRQWQAKLGAIDCYKSQHQVLWSDPDARHQLLTGYAMSVGVRRPGERYWRSRSTPRAGRPPAPPCEAGAPGAAHGVPRLPG